jgi:carboxyl-terminal processing protease
MKKTSGIIFRSVILLLAGVTIGLLISDSKFAGRNIALFAEKDKVSKVLELVRRNYVDSVNVDSVEGVTVNALLQNLDPHSLYLPAQQALSINEKLDGGFSGIGVEYLLLRDTLVITQIYHDGPADKAGLVSGDRVIDVNHEKFSGTRLTKSRVSKIFRSATDSALVLSVLPAANNTIKLYTVKRGRVGLSSLDAAYIVAPLTGYIKISKFASTTDADFRAALQKLKNEGIKKLVLDIRGNGGGYLNTATALADEFLTKEQLIVYTKGIHEPRTDYFATDSGAFQQGKLAVLIDEYSASASEILAGALQDLDRAVIVGRRSFGKGLVQEQFPFNDGSAINLTIARYYTPSGRSIQKSYKNGAESYRNELTERMRKGELFSEQSNLKDSIFSKPTNYHTSTGRKVFSGGGIMPDVFVPADTTHNTVLIHELTTNQIFTAYVIDRLQPALGNYATGDDFIKQYTVTNNELDSFVLYASRTLKEMDSRELLLSRDAIKTLLKAYAARFKWGEEIYFKTLNANDAALKKAVESLNR